MIRRLLIANRGEIACRIIRTARKLGIETVAIYSDADAHALHVEMADDAVRIGPAPVSESYLRGDVIIAAAVAHKCRAIHPGYGFLSENADFAEAVVAKGLTFVGPSAQAIRSMGLKGQAKALMAAAGVPVVLGYHGADQSYATLAEAAAGIGYPVLIKAVAGGGGKGMRQVYRNSDFGEGLASARAEAVAAFGNSDVLVEKLIKSPRHIEVQIFGDGTHAVHLFERDCSLQRRHQKVIEEAPAPGMTPAVRDAMTSAAVRAAEAIGYKGAGTIEFIAETAGGLRHDGFWFMEMNARLQVEHPVTEAVTGIDLVEWQLKVASGRPLPLQQHQIELSGHAVEARIYAEDVPAGFLPATGTIDHLTFPDTVRSDRGVRAGDKITPYYDPMIAKVIAHGPDRASAIDRLADGLATTRVAGTTTNLEFLCRLLDIDGFRSGQVHTGLIEDNLDRLTAELPVPPKIQALAIALTQISGATYAGFTLWAALQRPVVLKTGAQTVEANVACNKDNRFTVDIAGDPVSVHIDGATAWINDHKLDFWAHKTDDELTIVADGRWCFDIPDPLDQGDQVERGGDAIVAPMPGVIRDLSVAVGDWVTAGQTLAAMEAMKMELKLRAPRDGQIAAVNAQEDAQVAAGDTLIVLEPLDG